MTGIRDADGALSRVEDSIYHGYISTRRKISNQKLIEPSESGSRTRNDLRERTQHAARGCHEQTGSSALSRDIGQRKSIAVVVQRKVVIPIATDGTCGQATTFDSESWNEWGLFRE